MRRLLSPRWIAAHLVVVAVGVTFISLGFWQLSRNDQRRDQNRIAMERFNADPLPLDSMIAAAGPDIDTLQFRRATATGVFDPSSEVLIRSQVSLGTAGFHVVTPLVTRDGMAVLVNRGWVPLSMDMVPVTAAPPPAGETEIEGWIQLTQTRGAFGPSDPEDGRLTTLNRVDIRRIEQQAEYPLAEVYLVEIGERDGDLPVTADLPTFDDNGPHLAYAIQWFAFTLIGLVGYWFLMKRAVAPRTAKVDEPATPAEAP